MVTLFTTSGWQSCTHESRNDSLVFREMWESKDSRVAIENNVNVFKTLLII